MTVFSNSPVEGQPGPAIGGRLPTGSMIFSVDSTYRSEAIDFVGPRALNKIGLFDKHYLLLMEFKSPLHLI
jgi:hypothetical protein